MLFCAFVKYLPAFIFGGTMFLGILSYTIAVLEAHVYPVWPYMSEIAALKPERGIFTFGIHIVIFMVYIVIYIRYLEVEMYRKLIPLSRIRNQLHISAVVLGILSLLGVQILSCIVITEELVVHLVGSILFFLFGIMYCTLQTLFTMKIEPQNKFLVVMRICLTILMILFFFLTYIPSFFSGQEFEGESRMLWGPEHRGYGLHLVCTFSEWFLIATLLVFYFTFLDGFRKLDLAHPILKVIPPQPNQQQSQKQESKKSKSPSKPEPNASAQSNPLHPSAKYA